MASLKVLPSSISQYFGMPFGDYNNARVLAANTAEDITVPTGAKWAIFSANGDFYARVGGTATVPAADVTDGTASMLNPTLRNVEGVTTISVIASEARVVVVGFFA